MLWLVPFHRKNIGKYCTLPYHAILIYAHSFVFVGLGPLLESILISHARHLRRVNSFGVKKIMRNMLALQQRIRSITNERSAQLEKAQRYYSLFFLSPTVHTICSICLDFLD
jgi:hypothetical protein